MKPNVFSSLYLEMETESKENFEIGTSTEANKRKLNFLLLFVWLLRKLNARIENWILESYILCCFDKWRAYELNPMLY